MTDKFLIVRTDRLGDVLLTTPVSTALRRHFPNAKISWLVRPYAAPALENNSDVDEVLIDRGEPTGELAARLRESNISTALVAYPRWRTTWALWRANVARRIGPANKWYSIFFTDRIVQHRSRSERHEADYNLELLAPLGVPFKRYPTRWILTDEEKESARRMLEGHRLDLHRPLLVMHPGSGGSSPRWPMAHFMALGDRLQEAGVQVVVTAGPSEAYQPIMLDQMRRAPVMIAAGSVSVRALAAIFGWANVVVSNSTGPLHIAVALGVPTVSVYSSKLSCHPRRWGPYPAYRAQDPAHAIALAPEPGGEADMAAVSVDDVLALCQQRLQVGRQASVRN